MGHRPQHRGAAHAARSVESAAGSNMGGAHAGRHRARRRTTRGLSGRTLGTLAALATVGAVGGGVMSDAWFGIHPAAAGDDVSRAASSGTTAGASPGGTGKRPAAVTRRAPALSRSETRAESRTTNRSPSWLAGCRTSPGETGASNGRIPISDLCAIPDGLLLRDDAAAAWARLGAAYEKAYGDQPCTTGGYRSLDDQQRLYSIKPGLAARPGTSNHGWGVAVDLCGGIESFGTDEYLWMQENAGRFGWQNPRWAQAGGSRPEPWHWEFVEESG